MSEPQTVARALALFQQAQAQHASSQFAEAAGNYREALRLLPSHPGIVAGYAALAEQVRDWPAAEKLYRRLGQLRPDSNFEGRLAVALLRQDKYTECAPYFRTHLQRHPQDIDALHALALVYDKLTQWESALDIGRQMAAIKQDARATSVILNSLQNLGRGDELDLLVENARKRYPDDPDVLGLCGVHLIKRGQLKQGFEYQRAIRWRFDKDQPDPRQPPTDWWDGKLFAGTLLVAGEQGLGEEILASSMFRDLVTLGQRTVVECEPRLLPIFRRSFPQLEFVPRWAGHFDRMIAGGIMYRRIKSLDLAYFLRRMDTLPPQQPWLLPDSGRVSELRNHYRQRWPGKKIAGLTWRSSRVISGTAGKSLPVLALEPLLTNPSFAWINVQYGEHNADITALETAGLTPPWTDPALNATDDLDGLLAQLCALDGLVTVSNSTAHLAGAAGVRGYVLLPRAKPVLWYWGYEGERTPWYPSLRLLRNESEDEYGALLQYTARLLPGLGDTSPEHHP